MICCRESIVSTVRTEELVVHNQFKSNFIWFSLLKSSSSSSQNACDMFQGFTNLIEFIDHLILWTLSLSQTNNSIIIINAQTKLWFNLIQSVFVSDAHHKHTYTHIYVFVCHQSEFIGTILNCGLLRHTTIYAIIQ